MKRWTLLTGLAALALGAALFQPGCGGRAGAGLGNFGRVAEGLYRGAQPTDEGLDSLKAMGVRTVVNLRHFHGSREEQACRDRGLDYVRIQLASSDAPTDEDVKRFLEVATDPGRRPLYFHCMHGQDRTGTMCAAYRMAVDGWPLEKALSEMDAFGFNPLWKDLRAYVRSVPGRLNRIRPSK